MHKLDRQPLYCKTFGRFVRLPENRAARLACSQLIKGLRHQQRTRWTTTYLHGHPGVGKSHLVQLVFERMRAPQCARVVAARDLGKLLSGQTADPSLPASSFRQCDLLIVEDLQHLAPSTAAAVASLLDHRHTRRRATIVTASAGPMDLRELPARLTSRLSSGLVVRLLRPASASLQILARCWCRERGFRLSASTVTWVVERSETTPRLLFGTLTRLYELCRDRHRPPDIHTAHRLLGMNAADRIDPIEAVADRVAKWFHLSVPDLRGRARRPSLLWPRQVAQYVARRKTELSLAAIGSYFGRCDHSTVLNALRRVEERLNDDPGLARAVQELTS